MFFPTTQWSLLAKATLDGETQARSALEDLCRRYWVPLREFIRLRGFPEAEAEDLTQGFLLHLLEHSTLKKADRLQGRFRSFLLGALVRFLADERDRRLALKRGGGATHFSIDQTAVELAAPPDLGTIRFDREWALVILENALRLLEDEFVAEQKEKQFAVLRHFLPGAIASPSYEAAALQLGLKLPAFKSELHRLRRRFRTVVLQEVANTVSAPHEIEEEMAHLQQVLMDKGTDLAESQKPPPALS
jgi:RNA polymerase sigma-70 factor (ECF subfamily)